MNWTSGLFDWSLWQIAGFTLLLTHITIVSVTVYLHRFSAHRALDLHPVLQHFFRFWLWLTTGIVTREWTAIHRKHHARCETTEDPHSPVILGIREVFWRGAELYQKEARNPETLQRFGQGCPDDLLERRLYSGHPNLGIAIMGVIDLALFGPLGVTVWAVQMIWIPLFAAGVINGIGHHWGYRNFECRDAARNILPWGILIGGEELHNNHHTYPNSARLQYRAWEFDLGWQYIRLFQALGLAKVHYAGPVAHRVSGKRELDSDTLLAIINNRFQIMAQYRRQVTVPVLRRELEQMDASARKFCQRAKSLLTRERNLLDEKKLQKVDGILSQNEVLQTIYEQRLNLQAVWQRASLNHAERLAALRDWCRQAEVSGIEALQDFAEQLRSYTLQPAN